MRNGKFKIMVFILNIFFVTIEVFTVTFDNFFGLSSIIYLVTRGYNALLPCMIGKRYD